MPIVRIEIWRECLFIEEVEVSQEEADALLELSDEEIDEHDEDFHLFNDHINWGNPSDTMGSTVDMGTVAIVDKKGGEDGGV